MVTFDLSSRTRASPLVTYVSDFVAHHMRAFLQHPLAPFACVSCKPFVTSSARVWARKLDSRVF